MIATMKIFAVSLLPTPTRVQQSTTVYMPKDLQTCCLIFIRESPIKANLTPAYSGPYIVLSRNDRVFTVLKDGKAIKVAINNVKPGFCFNDQSCPPHYLPQSSPQKSFNTTQQPSCHNNDSIPQPRLRRYHAMPVRLQDYVLDQN